MRGFILVVVAVVVAVPVALRAQVPAVVGFDGVLFTDEECCGYSYEGPATFRLCDAPDGECKLGAGGWEEEHADAVVKPGYIHADLGATMPLPAGAFAGERWLEVELGGGIGVLSPRIRLTSVPYAWQCMDAATVGGQTPAAFAPASHQHAWSSVTGVPAALSDGQVSWEEVTGKPATFPPWGHVHAISDVTDLQAALNEKSSTAHNHDGTYAPVAHAHDDRYYTETEADAKLGTKADKATTYTRGEVDLLFAGKEDAGECFTKAEVTKMLDDLKKEILAAAVRGCPSDMVAVGDFCVDRYEPSLWAKKVDDGKGIDCGALQAAVDEAIGRGWTDADIYKGYEGTQPDCLLTVPPALCAYRQYGSPPGCNSSESCDDYPSTYPDSGNWTKPLYACAIEGVTPSRSMTWFQAQQACVNAGKHLITNGEWQAAVAGTPDTNACNTTSGGTWKTGKGTCKSAAGVEDMIGNLWEWTDLWGQAGPVNGSYSAGASVAAWPASYGDGGDKTWNVNGQADGLKPDATRGYLTGLPFAAFRGGNWDSGPAAGAFAFHATFGPSLWDWGIGLRCARGR